MALTPLLQRLGLVLMGIGLVMGPIANPLHVTVVFVIAALLVASSVAADLLVAEPTREA